MRFSLWLAIAFAAFLGLVSPSYAQATRTWVSGVGDDANPCSRTAPCKTFAGAISKTAARGEINCLDPGGFGAVTITKSISILCGFTEGGILASGTNGVIVNATTTDSVVLDGLDFDGAPGTGLNGVRVISASKVIIRNCTIRNFRGSTNSAGVDLEAPATARVFVESSALLNNNNGVYVKPTGGGNQLFLERTLVDSNVTNGVYVDAGGTILLIGSTITGSTSGVNAANGGTATTYGNNVIRGTTSPLLTQSLQ